MKDTVFDLNRLIHPIDPQAFKRDYWEKQPLIVRRGSSSYYRDLLSLADVDQILSVSSIRPPQIRVVYEGKDVPLNSAAADALVGATRVLESLYAEYRRGATIVLQFLHERWEPLARLCRTLSSEFSASFQTNVYLTPARERALGTHYDTHDVFVLQAEGSKHWRIYEAEPIRLPLGGQPYDRQQMKPGRLLEEFDLHAGDLVYIPRGWMHDATSRDSTSLHLTVGANTITWAAVILRAVESVIEREPCFRESLPPGFALREELRRSAEAKLTDLLARLIGRIEPASLLDEAVREALAREQPVLDGHLLDLERVSQISLETRVRRRPEIQWTLEADADVATLYFHGKIVQTPSYTERDLRFMAAANEFTPADLPGELDDEGKLLLVKQLVREGFLTISDRVLP
jgi:ribosomal protein L16 Arg81 hydroxylase